MEPQVVRDRSPKPERITQAVLLLVEGKDSHHFFGVLCKHLGLSRQLQIINFGGVSQFRSFLAALVGASGFADVKSIGIIRDAEDNPGGAFASVQVSLKQAGLTVPTTPEQLSRDKQRAVGVLILPGQDRPGMLETLLCETFASASERRCVDAFFGCVKEQCPDAKVRNPDKARARVFLATKPDSYPSVGVAGKKGYWNLDHEALEPPCRFLKPVAAAAESHGQP